MSLQSFVAVCVCHNLPVPKPALQTDLSSSQLCGRSVSQHASIFSLLVTAVPLLF